jgi:hypothetical protein
MVFNIPNKNVSPNNKDLHMLGPKKRLIRATAGNNKLVTPADEVHAVHIIGRLHG